jgi:hypothetical protein
MKVCNTCHRSLPLSEFYKNKATPDGLQYPCKSCDNKKRKSKPFRKYSYSRKLQEKYKLSVNEYERMLHDQKGMCLICLENKPLVVDHDHKTGQVRGLLCQTCNSGLGMFKDSIDYLKGAIDYLTYK